MSNGVDKNQHSVYKLTYHLVLVIKYRRDVINQEIFNRLMRIFDDISVNYNIECLESNWESDHIHILFKATPQTQLSKFINAYKSASSRRIKKEFPEIQKDLWKSAFWKTGYFITTTCGANIETVKKYISNQRKKL